MPRKQGSPTLRVPTELWALAREMSDRLTEEKLWGKDNEAPDLLRWAIQEGLETINERFFPIEKEMAR